MRTNLVRILQSTTQDILSHSCDTVNSCRVHSTARVLPATTPLSPVTELSAADPKLGKLIERAGPFTLRVASTQSPFEALVETSSTSSSTAKPPPPSIAACSNASIRHLRPRADHPIRPASPRLPQRATPRRRPLRTTRSLALRDLAAKTIDGTVPTLAHIRRMSDEAIIEHLTQVRGIGRWTVEMLLIFRLGRPDVLPVDDYGVRKGFALTFGKLKPTDKVTPVDLPKPDDMQRRAKKWQPWRSVASWYLWRACDLAKPKT